MQPQLRYLVYTLAVAVCTAYLVQMETVEPGSLKLLVYTGDEDTLGTSEYSPIENLQVLLLAACALLFAWVAKDCPSQRPIAFLFGGIAAAGVVRELDFFIDRFIADNAWQIPVGTIAALLIVYTWRHRKRFRVAWLRLWPSPGLTLIYAGAIVEFIFAQAVGHEPLWQAHLGDAYQRLVKMAVEEWIELMGYFIWLIGTLEYAFQARAVAQKESVSAEERRRRTGRRGTGKF